MPGPLFFWEGLPLRLVKGFNLTSLLYVHFVSLYLRGKLVLQLLSRLYDKDPDTWFRRAPALRGSNDAGEGH